MFRALPKMPNRGEIGFTLRDSEEQVIPDVWFAQPEHFGGLADPPEPRLFDTNQRGEVLTLRVDPSSIQEAPDLGSSVGISHTRGGTQEAYGGVRTALLLKEFLSPSYLKCSGTRG
jgi:hypothetical protein